MWNLPKMKTKITIQKYDGVHVVMVKLLVIALVLMLLMITSMILMIMIM